LYRRELAHTYNLLGNAWTGLKGLSEADEAWRQAQTLFTQLVANTNDPADHMGLGMVHGNLGWSLTERKQWREAKPWLAQAVHHLQTALKSNPKNPDYRQILYNQYRTLAETLVQLKEHDEAAEAATALAGVLRDSAEGPYFAACFLARCVRIVQESTGGSDAARSALAQRYTAAALGHLRTALDRGYPKVDLNDRSFFEPLQQLPEFNALRALQKGKKAP